MKLFRCQMGTVGGNFPRKSRKSDREAKAFKNTFLFRSLELVQQHVSFAYLNSVWFCFIAGKKKKSI